MSSTRTVQQEVNPVMGHKDRPLKSPGSTGRTPPTGRASWSSFINNVKGYLKWSLEHLDLDELVYYISGVYRRQLRQEQFSSVEKRLTYLRTLRDCHTSLVEVIDKEIQRCHEYLAEQDDAEYHALEDDLTDITGDE